MVTGLPSEATLWIVTRALPDSTDSEGHPGDGIYYPSVVDVDSSGHFVKEISYGYDGISGLRVQLIFVQAGPAADSAFRGRARELGLQQLSDYPDAVPLAYVTVLV
jgi:hypothetical protein